MTTPTNYPAVLHSTILGELAHDASCCSFSNRPEDYDPDEHRPGKPYAFAWAPPSGTTPAEFLATLERTWRLLFDQIDRVLQSCIPLIAEQLSACNGDDANNDRAAKRLANPDRIKIVSLDLSDSRKVTRHEVELDTSVCYDELGGHDLYIDLGPDFEPLDVRFDG
jgi:hypothetical protein